MRGRLLSAAAAIAALLATAPAALAAPDVHAHRGGPYVERVPTHPENTLPAFRAAAREGYVLELDVKLSADRVPLVIHDATFDRTTTCAGRVDARTAAQASRTCRADVLGVPGNASGLPVERVEEPHVRVPRLATVLRLARAHRASVNVEIKNLPTDPDFDPGLAYANRVLAVLDAAGLPRSRVIVQSFWPPNLLAAELRGYTTSLLSLGPTNVISPEGATALSNEWVSPAWPVDELYVLRARLEGRRVVPYTLDRQSDLRGAARIGVDAVISNDPTLARRIAGG